MSYSGIYTDETGVEKTIQITNDDSVEAMKNDYEEMIRKYDPRRVRIIRVQTNPGEAMHLKVTVLAPSHYLTSHDDTEPKACTSMTVDIVCYPGYPLRSISAFYSGDHFLASPNVFRSGAACIDLWIPMKSSLVMVTDKLCRDILHDPQVSRYDSIANPYMVQWHKDGVATGRFPTIDPRELYMPELPALPPRRKTDRKKNVPPLPKRRERRAL